MNPRQMQAILRAAGAHCDGMDGPVVQSARRALEAKDVNLVLTWVEPGDERFHEAMAAKSYRPDDVAAGRSHVARYVTFIHFVERLYGDATRPAEGHFPAESGAVAEPDEHDAH
jgi:hypothetical protein